jgi:hypothetical protein
MILQRVDGLWQAHRASQGFVTDLPSAEVVHLRNLRDKPTMIYTRGTTLQKELRHLRDLGLIKNSKPIAELPETFQLNQYFDLTGKGNNCLQAMASSLEDRKS